MLKMEIETRKKDFKDLVFHKLVEEPNHNMINDFIDYWSEHSPNGKKMRFEKEPVFDIRRRFATWRRNADRFKGTKPMQLGLIDKATQSHDEAKRLLGL